MKLIVAVGCCLRHINIFHPQHCEQFAGRPLSCNCRVSSLVGGHNRKRRSARWWIGCTQTYGHPLSHLLLHIPRAWWYWKSFYHAFFTRFENKINTLKNISPQNNIFACPHPLFRRWIGHMPFLQKPHLSLCWVYVYKPDCLDSRHFFLFPFVHSGLG